ncbi:MAG: hypothetical protein LUD07_01940 [Clostridiales bacterium]|nr:hypothetical protein [Clostridiales bacterium]
MKGKQYFAIAGCALMLCACTQSNIVAPQVGKGEDSGDPDFNVYFNYILDEEQLRADVEDVALDPADYPMTVSLDFTMPEDETPMDVTLVIRDETDVDEIGWYAGECLKVINDQVAAQDYQYAESGERYFGGLYQDKVVYLKVYFESDYPDGEPIIDAEIPEDTYMRFEP